MKLFDGERTAPVPGTGDMYYVTTRGRIWSQKSENWLLFRSETNVCVIMKKSYTVSRLVAQAFIPNPENKPLVYQWRGKADERNWVENLRWVYVSEIPGVQAQKAAEREERLREEARRLGGIKDRLVVSADGAYRYVPGWRTSI